jgi:hypothetical protein
LEEVGEVARGDRDALYASWCCCVVYEVARG